MKLHSLRIQNLLSFQDETIYFNDYTCLVGPNGSGKSTVIKALNIFFRENDNSPNDVTSLTAEDFHNRNTALPISVTVTFKELSSDAKEDFADYCRHDSLIISAIAIYEKSTDRAEVKHYGERLVCPNFKEFFKADGDRANVGALREIFQKIRTQFPALGDASSKTDMKEVLRSFENDNPDKCELIQSEDQFYGFSKGANLLGKYIQWVYVPAVKDASTEQMEAKNSALGKLLARTVRQKINFKDPLTKLKQSMEKEYQVLLDANQTALDSLSKSLQGRISNWANPNSTISIQWSQDPEKSIKVDEPFAKVIAGEGSFEGELTRLGHGFQRSFLISLLQELSGYDANEGPLLLLACEEPELFQHPPQARHLADLLLKLSQTNSQVIICTHSPYFISGDGFENVRLVKINNPEICTRVFHLTFEAIKEKLNEIMGSKPVKTSGVIAKIHQSLQPALNEMFFTNVLVLVEGLEDLAYIITYINLLDRYEEFRRLGCHILPVNGKSELIKPLIIAQGLNIPTYTVFDSDGNKVDDSAKKKMHERDNKAILRLNGIDDPAPFPKDTLWNPRFTMWNSDIGSIVEEDIGKDILREYKEKARAEHGLISGLEKNTLYIGTYLALAWEANKKSDSLIKLCDSILKFPN